MDEDHYNNLQKLCRICGERRNKGRPYHCQAFEDAIKAVFDVDISDDKAEVHPRYLCFNCQSLLSDGDHAEKDVAPVHWQGHDDEDDCWVCDLKAATLLSQSEAFAVPAKPAPKRRRSDARNTTPSKLIKEATGLKLKELNENIVCSICNGYVINATTITECLHTFCKSCIVKHLQTRQTCPTCKVLLHESAPMQFIRSDTTFQDIVNKVVPDLVNTEEKRIKEFYAKRGLSLPEKGNSSRPLPHSTDTAGESESFPPNDGRPWFHTNDIKISLSLEPLDEDPDLTKMPMKYIRCSMQLKVAHLAKFIQQKTLLADDLVLQCNKQSLDSELTIEKIWLDTWKVKEAPMRLFYKKKP